MYYSRQSHASWALQDLAVLPAGGRRVSAGAQTAREDLAFLRVLEGDDELVGRRLKAAREGTAGDGHRLSAGGMGISFGQGARAHHPAAVRSLGLSE